MASLIYLETNDYNKALENIKIAITLDSDNEEYLYTQGLIYNGMNMHINALNSFKLALEIKPDFTKPFFIKQKFCQSFQDMMSLLQYIMNYCLTIKKTISF
jgi:tetratricopeptide (TPR) repeat protein